MAVSKRISTARKSETDTPADPGKPIVRIKPPNLVSGQFRVEGISPYCQHAFSAKQQRIMEETQRQGQQSRGKRVREPKDFEALLLEAQHISEAGWNGIPAPAFRNAIIDACRLVGFKMTHAKLSVFIIADGLDVNDGTLLTRIEGTPRAHKAPVRNESGVADIRWRPMWDTWAATVRIQWDEDQFSLSDITHLLMRAGQQVGIGEGRPNSPNSNGLGFGRFRVLTDHPVQLSREQP